MSLRLIRANADLKQLADDGYDLEIVGGYLVLRDVPFVDATGQIRRGFLASSMEMAGDRTLRPSGHAVWFGGGTPHAADGRPLTEMAHGRSRRDLGRGLVVDHMLCSRPVGGYFRDYHEMMTTFVEQVSAHAALLDPSATARTGHVIVVEGGRSCFAYVDTASARHGIGMYSDRLAGLSIGIVGLGGTGSYILDQIAKTPVGRIHLFDDDRFDQHSAFRTPGAPSIDELREQRTKVGHLAAIYSRMHNGIIGHEVRLGPNNAHFLDHLDFVFLAIDSGVGRRLLVDEMERRGLPFIDTGIGLEPTDGGLTGAVRITTSTPTQRDHVHDLGRIPMGEPDADIYESRAQISDMNALAAVLAVIRFKKHFGFYLDLEREHHSVFQMDGAAMINEDRTGARP
ncbi:ThiF family adenylyltransferase [Novosphingobium rosa]|uniref:ThiF family adenylyltransferase n=1 Tax=Novosphingobium rosa TaxID=76978 RepID=UPI000830F042|nr:ThiF family adenylyltransferase [Novosphingobium rosa]